MGLNIAKRLKNIKDGGSEFDRPTINRPLKKSKSIDRPTGSIERIEQSIERPLIFQKYLQMSTYFLCDPNSSSSYAVGIGCRHSSLVWLKMIDWDNFDVSNSL
jgi:hypothetical protein